MVHRHNLTLVHDRMLLGRSKPNNLQLRKRFPSSPTPHHDFVPHLLTTKNASIHKMSENRPPPNKPTDSKTTIEIFKTKKLDSKMTP